jgi:hypothetical protein
MQVPNIPIDLKKFSGKENETVDVIWFDFQKQLEDILNDKELFSNMDNLIVNKNDVTNHDKRWLPYESLKQNKFFETLDGDWYQNYARRQIKDENKQFIVPIGLYIDASQCVTYQRYSFQPLIMYPLILTCKARNYPRSSRVLAFIPDLEASSSAVKINNKTGHKMNNSLPVRNYHKCLDIALASLKKVQKAGGFNGYIRLGNQLMKKMILVPVAFISGDAKSQDMLCGRYGTHNTGRMCRACDVSFKDSDKIDYKCKWFKHDHFNQQYNILYNECSTDKEKDTAYKYLRRYSQHICYNAFNDIDFAGFERGIFGCTPHDMMHCFQHGVLKYVTRIFINSFTSKEKALIDQFIEYIYFKFCSSESRNMLRYNFNRGMTNMTMITADEEVGQALVLLIIGQMDKGNNILENREGYDNLVEKDAAINLVNDNFDFVVHDELKFVEDETKIVTIVEDGKSPDEDNINDNCKCTYKNFIQCIEVLLSFHAWYKSTTPIRWSVIRQKEVLTSIRKMLQLLKTVFPRDIGHGWKLQKFHELLHLPIDISNFGSAKNFDTGIMENRLIHVGKHNAKLTQKRGNKIFTEQLGNRLYEQMLFSKTCRNYKLDHGTKNDDKKWNDDVMESDNDINEEYYTSTTLIDIREGSFQLMKEKPDYIIKQNSNNILDYSIVSNVSTLNSKNIPSFITDEISKQLVHKCETVAKCFTYAIFFPKDEKNESMKKRFRCHPNYNSKQWFDWCVIDFGTNNEEDQRRQYNNKNSINPAYPYGHYPCKVLCFFKIGNFDDIYVVVHATEYKKNSKKDSVLSEIWYLEYEKPKRNNSNERNAIITTVEIDSLSDSCYVVQETPGLLPILNIDKEDTNLVVLIKHRSSWSKYFT